MLLYTTGWILLECLSALLLQFSWWPPHLQNRSPWWYPWAWRKEKSHTEQGQVNAEVVPAWRCCSWLRTAECSGHCEHVHCHVEAATNCPATTLISSCALSEANAAGSLCKLTDWLPGPMARTHSGQCLLHQRMWSTWFWLLTLNVFFSLASVTLDSSTGSSGTWLPSHTQKSTCHQQQLLF